MGLNNWLEDKSDAFDDKVDMAIYMTGEYGFLTALGCSLPTTRAARLTYILCAMDWIGWDREFDTEQDICEEIDDLAISLYTERYNEIKYWWMPSK